MSSTHKVEIPIGKNDGRKDFTVEIAVSLESVMIGDHVNMIFQSGLDKWTVVGTVNDKGKACPCNESFADIEFIDPFYKKPYTKKFIELNI